MLRRNKYISRLLYRFGYQSPKIDIICGAFLQVTETGYVNDMQVTIELAAAFSYL